MDVGEPPVVDENDQIHNQRHSQFHSHFPQFEWVDHQAQEPDPEQVPEQVKQTQMIVKRNVSDSQKAEVRKDKVKMLADAVPEQMNIFDAREVHEQLCAEHNGGAREN